MQWMVIWCIGLSIGLFIGRECVLLYMARTKRLGILLESPSNNHYINKIPPMIRLLDIVLTAFIISTILLYIIYMYNKLSTATTLHELHVIDIGIALLVYILFPSRAISHFITENGLQRSEELTRWESVYLVIMGKQAPVRRMTYVQFKARGRSIEGYIYDRDLQDLRKKLAPHAILFKEAIVDISRRD